MSIYSDLQQVARTVLSDFSQGDIYLVQKTPGTGPADNPGSPVTTRTRLQQSVASGITEQYAREGFSTETDLIVTSAVVEGITPDATDFIEIDGTSYKIIRNTPIPAAGVKVAWKFIVRKGG